MPTPAAPRRSGWWRDAAAIALAAAALAVPHRPARAQPRPVSQAAPAHRFRVVGVFDLDTGTPVPDVDVTDVLTGASTRTSSTGTAAVAVAPDAGAMLRVRRVGYALQTLVVTTSAADTLPITVLLKRVVELPTVKITESAIDRLTPSLRGFEERRAGNGGGRFLGDSLLRANESTSLGQLVAQRMPGLTLVGGRGGTGFLRSTRKLCAGLVMLGCTKPNCYVAIFEDGVRTFDPLADPETLVPDIGHFQVSDYAGVEFYADDATVPARYAQSGAGCGVLLLWSRAPQ